MSAVLADRSVLPTTADWILDRTEWLCGMRFRPYQRSVLAKIAMSVLANQGRKFTFEWARQIGKTEGGQALILGLMVFVPMLAREPAYAANFPILREYANGFLVGFIAPKLQTARIPFKRLRRIVHSRHVAACFLSMGIAVVTSSSQELTLSNGSWAMALSGSPAAFQEGETLHFAWFEETQKLGQYQVRKQFAPMLSATNGTAVEVGTAGTMRGVFAEDIESNQRLDPDAHSRITWRQAIEIMRRECPGDPWADRYEAYVLREISRLPAGEHSESFRLNYELEWILKAYQLIDVLTWSKLRADGKDGRPHFRRGEFSDACLRRIFGLDLAKAKDESVCSAGEEHTDHARLVDWLTLRGTDYVDQVHAIVPWVESCGYLELKRDARMTIDSTGVGDPVTDMMKRELRGITGLVYSLQSKDALYKLWTSRLPKVSGGCGFFYPDCDARDREFRFFELQMLNCVVETRGNCIAYHHPDKDESDEDEDLLHDDYVDSLFNMLHAGQQPRGTFTSVSTGVADKPRVGVVQPTVDVDAEFRRLAGVAIKKQLAGITSR